LPKGAVIVALGTIAHVAVLRACGLKAATLRFAHGAEHRLPGGQVLLDSYHCSRYNTNTRRLTPAMFNRVFARARHLLGG
jgi:uracil-DNA glycosylase